MCVSDRTRSRADRPDDCAIRAAARQTPPLPSPLWGAVGGGGRGGFRGKLPSPQTCYVVRLLVESRCGAVSVGRTYLFPPLSSGGALVVRPWLRFHIPLIEPDRRLSRIRLSDKTSRLRPRHVAPERGQAYEPEVPVEVREWISPALASPVFVMIAQPPA